MAANFRDMAAGVKADHDKVSEAEAAKYAADRETRSQAVDAGVEALEKAVVPILMKAKAEIGPEGIDCRLTTHYDVKNYVSRNPSLSFRCICPRRRSDGWQYEGPPIFFESNGSNITAGAGNVSWDREPTEKLGSVPIAESEPLVEKAVQKAIEIYYKGLKETEHVYGNG